MPQINLDKLDWTCSEIPCVPTALTGLTKRTMAHMSNKPVTVARTKTRNVQRDVQAAEAKLHSSNAVLGGTGAGAGKVLTTEAARAVVAQNVEVEQKLHEAVQELEVVSELLNVAEAAKSAEGSETLAGRRSGAGLDSLMGHMTASSSRRPRRDPDLHAAVAPAPTPET